MSYLAGGWQAYVLRYAHQVSDANLLREGRSAFATA